MTDLNGRLWLTSLDAKNAIEWFLTTESGKAEWSFFDDLFRCHSHNICLPHAGNPAIPVCFSCLRFRLVWKGIAAVPSHFPLTGPLFDCRFQSWPKGF